MRPLSIVAFCGRRGQTAVGQYEIFNDASISAFPHGARRSQLDLIPEDSSKFAKAAKTAGLKLSAKKSGFLPAATMGLLITGMFCEEPYQVRSTVRFVFLKLFERIYAGLLHDKMSRDEGVGGATCS
jgi:hypothetical protein